LPSPAHIQPHSLRQRCLAEPGIHCPPQTFFLGSLQLPSSTREKKWLELPLRGRRSSKCSDLGHCILPSGCAYRVSGAQSQMLALPAAQAYAVGRSPTSCIGAANLLKLLGHSSAGATHCPCHLGRMRKSPSGRLEKPPSRPLTDRLQRVPGPPTQST
jgi:hypothetical protein